MRFLRTLTIRCKWEDTVIAKRLTVEQAAKLIIKREYRCEICGYSEHPEVLEVHHIIERSRGGSNDEKNLQVVCPTCHALQEHRIHPDNVVSYNRQRSEDWYYAQQKLNSVSYKRLLARHRGYNRAWYKEHGSECNARRKELRRHSNETQA